MPQYADSIHKRRKLEWELFVRRQGEQEIHEAGGATAPQFSTAIRHERPARYSATLSTLGTRRRTSCSSFLGINFRSKGLRIPNSLSAMRQNYIRKRRWRL